MMESSVRNDYCQGKKLWDFILVIKSFRQYLRIDYL